MNFREKLQKTYAVWFTTPPLPSEPPVETPIDRDKRIVSMLSEYNSGLVITCGPDGVSIYTGAQTEDEALKFLLELTYSNYFVSVYNYLVKHFPNVEQRYVEKIDEIMDQHESKDELILDNDDDPIISPLSMGMPK